MASKYVTCNMCHGKKQAEAQVNECPNCGERMERNPNEEWECIVCEHATLDCHCTYCLEQRDVSS